MSLLLKALHGAGHPQLKRESAADVGTETHTGCQPRAPAVPEGSSTAVHAQSRGRPGLAHPRDSKRGHRCQWAAPVPRSISQARSQDHRPVKRRRWSPDPRAWGRLGPTQQTRCVLIPALLPAHRGCWGHILEGQSLSIVPVWATLPVSRGFQECSAGDPGCQDGPGHLHLCAPETSRHPSPLGTDPQHAPTRPPLGKTPTCPCLLLYFPKFLDSCFLIHSDRGKKCHANSSIGSYILVLYNIIVLYYIERVLYMYIVL